MQDITLQDAVEFIVDNRGKTVPTVENGIPLIATNCVNNSHLYPVYEKVRFVDQPTYETWFRGHPQPGDLLFVTKGTPGRVCMVPAPVGFCIGQDMVALRANSKIIDPNYFFAVLRSPVIQSTIKNLDSDGIIPHFRKTEFDRLKLPYPSRKSQEYIGNLYFIFSKAIENNERRIKILEEMAKSIYREWFVNYRFPGHENVRMVDSELGEIPEGWEVSHLKDICSQVSYGYTASSQQEPVGPKFLRITDIVPDSIDWESVPYCEIEKKNLEKHLLKEGDIVVARTGATTGYAKRINKRHPVSVYASYLVRLRVESGSSVFAGLAVESDAYKRFIKSNIGGAAQPNANAQVLTSYPICLPPRQILLQLEAVVQDFIDQREILQEKNRHLRQTRDLLLPKLISGELDVEELDIAVA